MDLYDFGLKMAKKNQTNKGLVFFIVIKLVFGKRFRNGFSIIFKT